MSQIVQFMRLSCAIYMLKDTRTSKAVNKTSKMVKDIVVMSNIVPSFIYRSM